MKNINKKSRDAARTDTRGVGISSMRKSIYLLTTTPTSHTHTFHPLSTIVMNFAQVKSTDDNCGEWVECMVGVVGRRRVWLVGVGGNYVCR